MNKKIFIIVPVFLIGIAFLYFNLPVEVLRKSDIKFGSAIVERIEKYQRENGQLPEPTDMKTLKELGFRIEMLGTDPSYMERTRIKLCTTTYKNNA